MTCCEKRLFRSLIHIYKSRAGGALNFISGASHSSGGKPVLALDSTVKNGTVSRIVQRLMSLVTDPQMDTEFVVTEHGVANLKDKPTRERTLSLINVGQPKSRDELTEGVCRAVLI